ncbi:YraN family protein [Paenibacillus sp. F411]|uniref:YraN family protein n=1 Tax=Paenibacillus sp. F411 TaxID=2820239 RepID=UPI001AAF927B|nr:YraN family protein [Paenibacillus sp. F411]MBO2942763.1 YraN family protein [Paenibacillus sp. F411]
MNPNGEPVKATRQQKGAAAEQAAAWYLHTLGYTIRERNWRCRYGELDLIVSSPKGDTLVFVEVRSRSSKGIFGTPAESVNIRKMQQVRAIAGYYLHYKGVNPSQTRFDVIAVSLLPDLSTESLEHIQDAF